MTLTLVSILTADDSPVTERCPVTPNASTRPQGPRKTLDRYTVDGITVLAYSHAHAVRLARS